MSAADRRFRGLRGSGVAELFQVVIRSFAIGSVLIVGCESQSKPAPSTATAQPATPAPPRVFPEGPARMEFSPAKVTWVTPEILQFELPYKFTSGGPRYVYTCSFDFPGTTVRGATPLDGGDLQLEGVIKTKIAVGENDVKTYTVEMYEALAQDSKYYSISSSTPGDLPARPEDSSTNPGKKPGT